MLTVLILVLSCSSAEASGVRMLNGEDSCSGTPLVLYNGLWRKVHSTTFDYRAAAALCRQLDCGNVVAVSERRDWKWKEIRVDVRCEGQEAGLSQCRQHDVDIAPGFDGYNTFLICSDSVRLVDGGGFCSGRLEVKSHQSWTTVCEADFDWQDAEVVCRELGCGSPLTLQGALSGEEKYQFGTNKFQCIGTEKHLLTCSTSAREEHTCTRRSAVVLTCSGPDDVRLVGGHSRCAGRVELRHSGRWRRVEADGWSVREAGVACRQLRCGRAVAATHAGGERAGQLDWAFEVHCTGSEAEVRACSVRSVTFVWETAGVVCSDLLVQPSIFFSAPIRPSRDLQGPAMFRGHSFTITCSTQPQYPGGSFHLTLPWNNISHAHPAVNHSASFPFPAADDYHQRNYRCVYHNLVIYKCVRFSFGGGWYSGPFIHNFSSKSEILTLTMTDLPLLAAITRLVFVVFLLMISCWIIFLIDNKCANFFMTKTPGHKGAAAAVQYKK
ncbi:CD5 antigen-like isoform X2 [Brachyhypopomus gauderio]|uniref:CD5 antigen-like isoform X2 n=1 Tax=Brachyhypopomus gauderio TaxID=698409 RepID=UPI00404237E3